jgi:hemerythrin
MAHFDWKDEYSVKIAAIDLQHKRLVNMINDLFEAMQAGRGSAKIGSVLDGLVSYARTHFTTEENLLREHGYPELEAHIKTHQNFTAKIADMQRQFKEGRLTSALTISNFLKDWLVNHIVGTDRHYADFLVGKGLR